MTESEYRLLLSHVEHHHVTEKTKIIYKKKLISGAIYIVRKGSVKITGKIKSYVVSDSGYFGEETMMLKQYSSKISAVANTDCDLSILRYKCIKKVLRDMSRIQLHTAPKTAIQSKKSSLDKSIALEDLKKHRILGVGTFGKVWLVSHEKNGQVVPYALKIQEKRDLIDNKQVEGVKREIKIMAAIDHPFVIKMKCLYQDKKSIMMLIELVPGGELFHIMKKKKRLGLPEKSAVFYSSCVLEGLTHMHSRDIAYRDLKPENVLIDSLGYVSIIDMGFAKVVKDKTFTLCGTPWYLAPEVIVGKGEQLYFIFHLYFKLVSQIHF